MAIFELLVPRTNSGPPGQDKAQDFSTGPLHIARGTDGKGRNMTQYSVYLRRAQAADYVRTQWGIPCSHGYLHKLASIGGGPVFRRAGKWPLYVQADLDAWARSRMTGPLSRASDAPDHQG
jgi:hypothetical protein